MWSALGYACVIFFGMDKLTNIEGWYEGRIHPNGTLLRSVWTDYAQADTTGEDEGNGRVLDLEAVRTASQYQRGSRSKSKTNLVAGGI